MLRDIQASNRSVCQAKFLKIVIYRLSTPFIVGLSMYPLFKVACKNKSS